MPTEETRLLIQTVLFGAILLGAGYAFVSIQAYNLFRQTQAHELTTLRRQRLGQLQDALASVEEERRQFLMRVEGLPTKGAATLLGKMIDKG